MPKAARVAMIACLAPVLGFSNAAAAQPQAVITLDPNTTYQTMSGWQASAQSGQLDCPGFDRYKDRLFDQAVSDLGINRITIPVRSGAENPIDYFTQYVGGQIGRQEWTQHWYQPINDNTDPFTIDTNGFQFSETDYDIDTAILPLKQRVEANGESLSVVLLYIDFGASAFEHRDSPEEYAELITAAFLHLQSKYGWVPDYVEVILEPDHRSPWSGAQIGQAMVAAGNRLKANGFNPQFIAPSTASMTNAVARFDEMIQVAGVFDYLSELSYHRYGDVSVESLQAIGDRAVRYGIKTAMLEHIGSGYEDLHQDLKVGRNSAWQQFTLAFCATEDNGGHYYRMDYSDPDNPGLIMASRTKFLRQYFKYIRIGAVRIGASSSHPRFDPLAFINTNGRYVVVVKSAKGGVFSIQGLPAGAYGAKYTTAGEYDVDSANVTLGAGQALNAAIPEAGVITVYAMSSGTSAATPRAATPVPSNTPAAPATPASTPTVIYPRTVTPTATPAPPTSCFSISLLGVVMAAFWRRRQRRPRRPPQSTRSGPAARDAEASDDVR